MALIRCTKHGIPYNDENPRGCPACAREREGGVSVAEELARASRAVRQPETVEDEKDTEKQKSPEQQGPKTRQETLNELFEGTARSIREPPRTFDEGTPSRIRQLMDKMSERKMLRFGIPAVVVLAAIAFFTREPSFVRTQVSIAPQNILPFPVQPGVDVEVAFSVLGQRAPSSHPTSQRITRYRYGENLVVDAINRSVYAITFSVPNRTWQGLTVGMTEQEVRGTLVLLGEPIEAQVNSNQPRQMGRFQVYSDPDDRALRQITAQVRPPNGCYDVVVNLRYEELGVLRDGSERYVVVGVGGQEPSWVSTRIRVIDRSMDGPYAGAAAC